MNAVLRKQQTEGQHRNNNNNADVRARVAAAQSMTPPPSRSLSMSVTVRVTQRAIVGLRAAYLTERLVRVRDAAGYAGWYVGALRVAGRRLPWHTRAHGSTT